MRLEGFLHRLCIGPLICDGAMGTMLPMDARDQWKVPEEINLSMPEVVQGMHRAYIEAGAQIVMTNTFGGNHLKLDKVGLGRKVYELNRSGAHLAREAAGDNILVAGSMGPTGDFLEPLGERSFQEVREAFAEQAAALVDGDVDILIVETMSALEEARAAIEGARMVTHLPIVCTMTFDTNLHTMMGVSPEQAVSSLPDWGADVVGANCGAGPQEMEVVMQRMVSQAPHALLAAQPNAGMPRLVDNRPVYDIGPEEMAEYAQRYASMGVRLIGACCGSTPAHIRAIARKLASPKQGEA